jgi:hypothetical protein
MSKKVGSKTLDTQHHAHLTGFQRQQHVIQEKQELLDTLKEERDGLCASGLSNLSTAQFDAYLSLGDRARDLEKELTHLKNATKEIDYYVDNADIIFKYYDIVENGNVAENETAAVITENSILKFFASHKEDTAVESAAKDEDRASLLERYMQQTDKNYLKSTVTEECTTCPICGSADKTLLINDGLVMCNECYAIETVIVDHEKPSYRDPPKEISYFSYKRLIGLLKYALVRASDFVWSSAALDLATPLNCGDTLTHPPNLIGKIVWIWAIRSLLCFTLNG